MGIGYCLFNGSSTTFTPGALDKQYPMPMTATKQYDIEVGRIRENDVFGEYGLDLFVSGDQVIFFFQIGRAHV